MYQADGAMPRWANVLAQEGTPPISPFAAIAVSLEVVRSWDLVAGGRSIPVFENV